MRHPTASFKSNRDFTFVSRTVESWDNGERDINNACHAIVTQLRALMLTTLMNKTLFFAGPVAISIYLLLA